MNNSLKFFWPILAVAVASFGLKTVKHRLKISMSALAGNRILENRGLVTIPSSYSVEKTGDRFLIKTTERPH